MYLCLVRVCFFCGGKMVNDCISVMRDVSPASLELLRSESKKANLEELSNKISERRCELKANEPVIERSE